MFIEIAELIKCPQPHEETYCVISPDRMEGRRIAEGVIGCPVCKAEFVIRGFVARFDESGDSAHTSFAAPELDVDAMTIQALLNLSGPGGNVVLVGSAARVAPQLVKQIGGVHFIGLNAPDDVEPSAGLSLLHSPSCAPLRSGSMRGVVMSDRWTEREWIVEAARVLLRGMRLVAFSEIEPPPTIGQLARENGMFVGHRK